jgi:hypothetical protein
MSDERESDNDPCGAVLELRDFTGRPFAVKCVKSPYHGKRGHSAVLGRAPGGGRLLRFRWPGEGRRAGERYPDSSRWVEDPA